MELIGKPEIYFSYGQLLVFDSAETSPGSVWTDAHYQQGFAKRARTVAFGTIEEAGTALLTVSKGQPRLVRDDARAVSVVLEVESGKLNIEGPEEYPVERLIPLPAGRYRVSLAQRREVETDRLLFFLFVELEAGDTKSHILKADATIIRSGDLIEDAQVA